MIKEGSMKRKKMVQYGEKLPSRLVGGQRADKALRGDGTGTRSAVRRAHVQDGTTSRVD
jgi:hypothetical protein